MRKPPFDFNEIEDPRGLYLDNRLLLNFKDKDLSGCVFYRCYPYISKLGQDIVNLNVASRKDVTYEGASITHKYWSNEDMYGQLFTKAKIKNADFRKCDLDEANFDHTDIESMRMVEVSAMGSSFKHTYMQNVFMDECEFVGSDFQHAKCMLDARQVDFSYSTFDSASLMNSKLSNCSFENAKLPSARLGWSIISYVSFKGADLRKANFKGASIAFSDFEGADMTGAIFEKKQLKDMQHTGLNKISQKQIDSLDVR